MYGLPLRAPKAKFTLPTERCENCWHQIINAATINLFQLKQTVFEVEQMFREQPRLEAVLISKSGHPNGELVGIVRPRDLASIHREKE